MAGGEHHSIARTKDGLIYCWGRNDEGQVGCGDTYGEWRAKQKQEEMERLAKQEEEKKKLQEEAARRALEPMP